MVLMICSLRPLRPCCRERTLPRSKELTATTERINDLVVSRSPPCRQGEQEFHHRLLAIHDWAIFLLAVRYRRTGCRSASSACLSRRGQSALVQISFTDPALSAKESQQGSAMSASPPRNGRDASPARSVSPRRDSPPPRGRSASPADRSVSPVPRSRSRSRTPVRRRRSSTPPR